MKMQLSAQITESCEVMYWGIFEVSVIKYKTLFLLICWYRNWELNSFRLSLIPVSKQATAVNGRKKAYIYESVRLL